MNTSDFFSFFSALSKFISDSDGKVVSDTGMETLNDPSKMKKVNEAVRNYHSDSEKQNLSKGILVEF